MRLFCIIFIVVFISCKKNTQTLMPLETKSAINSNEVLIAEQNLVDSLKLKECPIDSLNMQTSEFDNIKFYTENTMRGKGVIQFSNINKILILNSDKTTFGIISFKDDSYEITLPSKIIAREIIPDIEFQIFSFDAEQTDTDKDYLIIYINKEKKLVAKKGLKYNFLKWDDYIKSAFVQLTSNVGKVSKDEQGYWFKTIKIKGDSMQIKSIPKTNCDYVENYKNVTMWIKWKENNCKLIKFNFCY